MRKLIYSWLLHHANRNYHSNEFYVIKNKLLKQYGNFIGYDVQFIEGKKCHTCGGTGIYVGYYWSSGEEWTDSCNRCWGGWYKMPTWNILQRIQFGKYIFHQPEKRVYKKPEINITHIIEGYVLHTQSRHGDMAMFVLGLLFENGYLSRWYKSVGSGWRLYWWLPRNWIYNSIHIIKKGREAYPVQNFIRWWNKPSPLQERVEYYFYNGDCELPF